MKLSPYLNVPIVLASYQWLKTAKKKDLSLCGDGKIDRESTEEMIRVWVSNTAQLAIWTLMQAHSSHADDSGDPGEGFFANMSQWEGCRPNPTIEIDLPKRKLNHVQHFLSALRQFLEVVEGTLIKPLGELGFKLSA
jgi:hypothetical protein